MEILEESFTEYCSPQRRSLRPVAGLRPGGRTRRLLILVNVYGFTVQRFTVVFLSSTLFGGKQILDETSNDSTSAS